MKPWDGLYSEQDLGVLLEAVAFAAVKHQDQRRKGHRHLPYINHPVRVAETLWSVGGVRDMTTLVAALLHDTLEDTETTWKQRPCGRCSLHETPEGHDACLGTLPGVENACCGHGNDRDAFIQYSDGRYVQGQNAIDCFKQIRRG